MDWKLSDSTVTLSYCVLVAVAAAHKFISTESWPLMHFDTHVHTHVIISITKSIFAGLHWPRECRQQRSTKWQSRLTEKSTHCTAILDLSSYCCHQTGHSLSHLDNMRCCKLSRIVPYGTDSPSDTAVVYKTITNIIIHSPCAVRLRWLENSYSWPLFYGGTILTSKVPYVRLNHFWHAIRVHQ